MRLVGTFKAIDLTTSLLTIDSYETNWTHRMWAQTLLYAWHQCLLCSCSVCFRAESCSIRLVPDVNNMLVSVFEDLHWWMN